LGEHTRFVRTVFAAGVAVAIVILIAIAFGRMP
jgi:hypothetical protein